MGSSYLRLWPVTVALVSLTFGFLCILPNVWQRLDHTYPFQGIEIMGADQEFYYAARIGQVLRGDWMVGDPSADATTKTFVQPPLPEWVQGSVGLLLHLDTPRTVLVVKFLLGILLTIAMVTFFRRFTGHPWWSLLAVSTLLFAGFLSAAPWTIGQFFTDAHFGSEFLRFSRPTNPLFSSLLFFLVLHAFLSWAQHRSRKGLILAGILTGLSFYAYPYTWSYLGFTFALICLYFAYKRDWKRLGEMCLPGVIAAVVAVPYIYHQIIISHDPVYPEMVYRFILLHTRQFVGGTWMFAFMLLPLIPQTRAVFRPWWLLFGLAFAGFLSMDQQLVSNTTIVPQHYHWYYIHPLALMSWVIFVGVLLCPFIVRFFSIRQRSILFTIILLAIIGCGVRFQQQSYAQSEQMWGELQSASPMLQYITSHSDSHTAVFGWGFEKELVSLYTPAVPYLASNSFVCLCSSDRTLTFYFITLWLSGVSYDQAKASFFTSRRYEVSSTYRGTYWREAGGSYESIPDREVQYVLDEYGKFLNLSDDQKLTKYQMDYFVVPQSVIPTLANFSALTAKADKAFEDNAYVIWKIAK